MNPKTHQVLDGMGLQIIEPPRHSLIRLRRPLQDSAIKLFYDKISRWVYWHEFSISLAIDTKSNSVPRQPPAVLNTILNFHLCRPHKVLVKVELLRLLGPIFLPDIWTDIAFGESFDEDEEQDVSYRLGKRAKSQP
jgi:hypothetical protein